MAKIPEGMQHQARCRLEARIAELERMRNEAQEKLEEALAKITELDTVRDLLRRALPFVTERFGSCGFSHEISDVLKGGA